MRKEFVMRGQTASGATERLNFGGYKEGYAYRITELQLYPSGPIGSSINELCAVITAGSSALDPLTPNFNDQGLIATAQWTSYQDAAYTGFFASVVNDTYAITQDLLLSVQDTAGSSYPINWQCRFESFKMNLAEEAAVNYKQFTISDA